EQRVRVWAHSSLRTLSWELVEDAVADTCAGVAIDFERARGAETFAGFAYGQFLTVRRRLLRTYTHRAVSSLDGINPAAPEDDAELTTDQAKQLHGALAQLPSR